MVCSPDALLGKLLLDSFMGINFFYFLVVFVFHQEKKKKTNTLLTYFVVKVIFLNTQKNVEDGHMREFQF